MRRIMILVLGMVDMDPVRSEHGRRTNILIGLGSSLLDASNGVEKVSLQRPVTGRERELAEDAGFNPDLWSDDALREMMGYFESRMRDEVK